MFPLVDAIRLLFWLLLKS